MESLITQIRPNLLQGDRDGALAARFNKDIDVIVYLGRMLPDELAWLWYPPVVHMPMEDAAQTKEDKIHIIGQVIVNLISLGKRVLVCCAAGMSRSVVMCLYSLVVMGSSFDSAEHELRSKLKYPTFLVHPELYAQIKKMLTGQ